MRKVRFLMVAVLVCVLLAGCSQPLSQQVELLESTDAVFVAAVRVATVLKAAGEFTPQEVADINVIIHQTKLCLNAEAAYLKDPCNVPQPDWFNCATSGITQILSHTKNKGVKQ